MAKQSKKQRGEALGMKRDQVQASASASSQARFVAPPAKHPTLLAASVILFILWFVFLLFSAVWG